MGRGKAPCALMFLMQKDTECSEQAAVKGMVWNGYWRRRQRKEAPTPMLSLCVPASPELPCSWADGCRRKAVWQENRDAMGPRVSTCKPAKFQNTCGEQGITARGGLSKGETNTIHYDIHRAGISEKGPQSRGVDTLEQGLRYFRPQSPPLNSHTLLWHVSIEEQDFTKW